jgi:hypothetical protein
MEAQTYNVYAACNALQVVGWATATLMRAGGSSTGQNTLTLEVTGCNGQQQPVSSSSSVLKVAVAAPDSVTSSSTPLWQATSLVNPSFITLTVGEKAELSFSTNLKKDATPSATVIGTVTVSNAGSNQTMGIGRVTVSLKLPEPGRNDPKTGGTVTASCDSTTLAPGQVTRCRYKAVVAAAGDVSSSSNGGSMSGTITAQVFEATGTSSVVSAPVPVNIPLPAADAGSSGSTGGCVEVILGLMLGSALLVPGAAGPSQSQQVQKCTDDRVTVIQPIGPFTHCGNYSVSFSF